MKDYEVHVSAPTMRFHVEAEYEEDARHMATEHFFECVAMLKNKDLKTEIQSEMLLEKGQER